MIPLFGPEAKKNHDMAIEIMKSFPKELRELEKLIKTALLHGYEGDLKLANMAVDVLMATSYTVGKNQGVKESIDLFKAGAPDG